MRLLVHDYGGYAFPYQLSLELARRGHFVCHAYCADLVTTPPGVPEEADEPINLSVEPISLGAPLQKYDFFTRWRQERAYGRLIARQALEFGPDVVLSANTPLDAQRRLLTVCAREGVPFVFWLQDLLGVAAHRILRERIPVIGALIGSHYLRMERRLLRQSQAVVAITPAFQTLLGDWGIPRKTTHVIGNWAPLDRLPVGEKTNAWSEEAGLESTFNFLYAGTLGMKHNPERLLELARAFADQPEVRILVASQAQGAGWIQGRAAAEGLGNVVVLPYQSVDALPAMLAAADVLVALLEPDAGLFSVPSKVLAYLCAERALLLAVPGDNAAARIVRESDAGLVVEPSDAAGFVDAAKRLYADSALRVEMGRRARAHAEKAFSIDAIATRFEEILEQSNAAPAAGAP
ncbi:MAG: glycosyltransferase family 4 protein [Rhodothermales bacterium]|nr:glycosyltransferase family 4 protein [Rhodothermales bacterium]